MKNLVRDYILDGCILKEEMKNPNLNFGYKILYPPNETGKPLVIANPKEKSFIDIVFGILLIQEHSNAFETLEDKKKQEFVVKLANIVCYKGLMFNLRPDKKRKIYEIVDRIYFNENIISKNKFYKSIRTVFGVGMVTITFVFEFLTGKYNPENITPGTSLYT